MSTLVNNLPFRDEAGLAFRAVRDAHIPEGGWPRNVPSAPSTRLITFLIGTRYDKFGRYIPDAGTLKKAILRMAIQTFGGYTAITGYGGYVASNGIPVEEECLRLEILTDESDQKIRRFAEEARDLLRQESVKILFSTPMVEEV